MRKFVTVILLVGLLAVSIPTVAQAQSTVPETVVKNQVDALMNILDDTMLTQPENHDQLKQHLINEFEPLFVFNEMTRRALGAHARSLSKEQINELTVVFKDLLEEIYVSRLTAHLSSPADTAEIESIQITGADRRGQYARVNSTATFRKGKQRTTFNLNYKMVDRGDGWKIYDVEIESVSLIANYRSQFANVLTNYSYETLISRIREKLNEKRTGGQDSESNDPPTVPGLNNASQ